MKIYIANFHANNGTTLSPDLQDTNKARLERDIRQMAAAERFRGSTATWYVAEQIGDKKYKVVAAGSIHDWGYSRSEVGEVFERL